MIQNVILELFLINIFIFFISIIMIGTIKVLKEGFGFIKTEENEGDVFFHANNLVGVDFDDLNEGETLSFEIWEGKNGKQQANEVSRVEA